MQYDHKKIEKKWRDEWTKNKIYTTPDKVPGKDNFYLLVEFPYPSGNLHVGHWYSFAVPDILARYTKMSGKNVLYPIGFDAFGLPAENAAIKNNLNPRDWTEKNIAYMTAQIESMGTMFDWSRQVKTIDPTYYKWTQWLFLQLHKAGLAHRKETAVNWCPKDKTVLANEQVVDGKCERCGSEVIQKQMLQWNLKITDYADRLHDDLEALDWPKEIKESQRNWIGRSEGAEIDFPLSMAASKIKHVVLLHGKGGTAAGGFKPWMQEKLEALGYTVESPQLPNSAEPDDDEQTAYVMENCTLDESTVVVGHSFGGIVALRLLEKGIKLGQVTLVAMPYTSRFKDGKVRASVAAALEKGFNVETIKKNVGGIVAVYDTEDDVVPLSDGEEIAAKLDCLLVKGRGEKSHFNGKKEPDVLMATIPTIRVFTTRADTLFGATYLVLAPEHPWVTLALAHKSVLKNNDEVQKYVLAANKKTELERLTEQKEKTGVKLEGVEAINPATGEKIPLYVADYALATYGTGALMAVPSHDERDFAFAKKFDIPMKQVVAQVIRQTKGADAYHPDEPAVPRECVMCVVKHWEKDEYLCIQWKLDPRVKSFVGGGTEGEDVVAAGRKEILEESGYKNAKFVKQLGGRYFIEFYHQQKKLNRRADMQYLLFELENGEAEPLSEKEAAQHDVVWVKKEDLQSFLYIPEKDLVLSLMNKDDNMFTGEGVLINSAEHDGTSTKEARAIFTEKYGRAKKTYKLRDWIVSRQRYWGVPIPIIHCTKCGSIPVPDAELPVVLPEVEDYLPEGEGKSPLAKVKDWVNVPCPHCGGAGERETDTFDTFVDSSWYFVRYADPKNDGEFASKEKQDAWMPVDLYSGGAEHTTMHLLYSRFWHKALFDLGLVGDSEPYTRRMNRGIILGPDGKKMSKSLGNVIDPDEIVERLGADTVRMYLAFIGPYNEVASYPWNPNGVVGVRRFLERVGRIEEFVQEADVTALNTPLHKALKKIGEDCVALKFNTAISQLMILLNAIEAEKSIGEAQWKIFVTILAPFAPYLAEELHANTGAKDSVHLQPWPTYNEKFLTEDTVIIAIQIDGKTRGDVSVESDADKATTEAAAREAVAARLEGQEIARVIVVPGRLVNFVLKH